MGRISVILLAAFVLSGTINAQQLKSNQALFLEAEYFFFQEDYADALSYYLKLYEKLPANANIAYRLGICCLNIPGKKDLAISYLESAVRDLSPRYREGTVKQRSAPQDALYELGLAYKVNYQFEKAKESFRKYLSTLPASDSENIEFVETLINSCDVATEMINKPVSLKEENAGPLFNDERSNFNPLISGDGNTFAFMVSMKFYDAVMLSRQLNGKWSNPVNITSEIETDGDTYISCLSRDGNILFLSTDNNINSDIYTSTFDGSRWRKAEPLNNNINTTWWESHGFISGDGQLLVFASDRPGGFGGLDLYVSAWKDGDWGPAVNLGPEINTSLNEDRPFLINEGSTLFFASQGHRNIGGYDIFRSDLGAGGKWSNPVNMGYPLNTPDDNIFFMPFNSGRSGYTSLYRESGGFGNEDIYIITFDK